jgi:hypothetical protein
MPRDSRPADDVRIRASLSLTERKNAAPEEPTLALSKRALEKRLQLAIGQERDSE